jgi:uncharacterized membrane protein
VVSPAEPTSTSDGPAAPRPGEHGAGDAELDIDAELDTSTWSHLVAELLLGALVITWIVVFGALVRLRQDRLASFDFDMGIHDQSIWLLAHLRGFITVRGLQVFGHHATIGYLLYVPFSWLGAGPDFLNVSQVVIAGLGAVPVYLLARHRSRNAWLALALGAAFLLHPALQFFMAELFHPEVIAITPLLCAYYASVRRAWGWFAVFAVLAVCWKEDIALTVMLLGLLVALRGDRKVGFWTAGLSLAWFLAWTLAIFPILDHGSIQSAGLYSDVGGSPGGIARMLFTHPSRITSRIASHDTGSYLWKLGAPFALVGLAAPLVLALGVPQALLNLISNVPWTKTITFHYAALPLVAVTLASVEGACWLARRIGHAFAAPVLAVVVLASAAATTVAWGPSPVGAEYRHGIWPLELSPRVANGRAALAVVPGSASVAASYNLVPQLSERADVYTYPNPWESRNFGIDGWPRRSPATVDWIVLDEEITSADDQKLYHRLIADGRFVQVFERDGYVVARRTHR